MSLPLVQKDNRIQRIVFRFDAHFAGLRISHFVAQTHTMTSRVVIKISARIVFALILCSDRERFNVISGVIGRNHVVHILQQHRMHLSVHIRFRFDGLPVAGENNIHPFTYRLSFVVYKDISKFLRFLRCIFVGIQTAGILIKFLVVYLEILNYIVTAHAHSIRHFIIRMILLPVCQILFVTFDIQHFTIMNPNIEIVHPALASFRSVIQHHENVIEIFRQSQLR